MRRSGNIFPIILGFMLLVGCGNQPGAMTAAVLPAETAEPVQTIIPVQIETSTKTTEPEETVTEIPTPEPTGTPEPTPVPEPTREPFSKEGDITDRFPDYDTGTDAEFSYQSDELRIAIRKYVNPHDPDIPEVYYVADIWMRNIDCFRTGFGNGTFNTGREDGEKFAEREHAILAVNGTMNTGLVLHNRQFYKSASTAEGFKGVMVLYEDGTMQTFNLNRVLLNLESLGKEIVQAWHFGPVLIQEGKIASNFNVKGTRHPRIILGYYEPGHYCVVAVDGRSAKRAIGMNEYEMAELMQELGCEEAMNLDGGTSAIMVFMGRCINSPSGVDRDGDGKAGRNISDMLLFAEYDRDGNAPALNEIDASRLRLGEIE